MKELKDFISKLDVKQEDYTEESWKNFERNVDSAHKNLVTAYMKLRLKPNKDKLKDLLNK